MKNLSFIIALLLIAGAVWGAFFIAGKQRAEKESLSGIVENEKSMSEGGLSSEQENVYSNAMNTSNTSEALEGKRAVITTNQGVFTIELLADKAPETVANFVKLAEAGFYNETKFHRIIKDFMIQGGDPLTKDDAQKSRWGTGGPGYVFNDEVNDVALVKGVVAMANAGPNTNGSQFFIITTEATPWLQGKHTGFAKVVDGVDVVERIGMTEVGQGDVPLEDIAVISVLIQ